MTRSRSPSPSASVAIDSAALGPAGSKPNAIPGAPAGPPSSYEPDALLAWWVGPGIGCKGSRVIPTVAANGAPAFGQYKPGENGEGYEPWALQVLRIDGGRIVELTFFLDTERLFPLFGLPPRLTPEGRPAGP